MDVKTYKENRRSISRTKCLIIKGYSRDAAEQLATVQQMIGKAELGDLQAQAHIALATENAAKTVTKMWRMLGGGHELA